MNDLSKIITDKVAAIKNEYQEIINQIKPLQQQIAQLGHQLKPLYDRKTELEDKIRTIEYSLSLHEGTIIQFEEQSIEPTSESKETLPSGPLAGKKGLEAYKETIRNHFRDKSFTGPQLRDHVRKNGLDIKGSYGRLLIVQLRREGFIKRVRRGLYRFSESKQEGFGLI